MDDRFSIYGPQRKNSWRRFVDKLNFVKCFVYSTFLQEVSIKLLCVCSRRNSKVDFDNLLSISMILYQVYLCVMYIYNVYCVTYVWEVWSTWMINKIHYSQNQLCTILSSHYKITKPCSFILAILWILGCIEIWNRPELLILRVFQLSHRGGTKGVKVF